MRSPTSALLWEIWNRHRFTVAAVAGLTVGGRLLDFLERGNASVEPSSLVTLLSWASFALLFGIFDYTDSGDGRRLGRFPHRLFTLPVSSLRLVTIPVVAGILSVEVLYLLWLTVLTTEGAAHRLFVAVLLAVMMVFYQSTLWTLERLGPLRLILIGAEAIVMIAIGLAPTFPPSPPPLWRSQAGLSALMSALAVIGVFISWRYVVRIRRGGGQRTDRLERLIVAATALLPRAGRAFASPAAAHFWFEWRTAGVVLPALVAGMLLVFFGPLTWLRRDDASASLRLLGSVLAMPIALAIPVGMAFARPAFWSDDLSVPAFVAVRPLTDEDLVAIRIKVAVASVAFSFAIVLAFIALWLPLWANVDGLSQLAIQWWAFHEQSIAAVVAIATLIVTAAMFLTWRFLVARLWSGMSGRLPFFIAAVMSVFVVAAGGMMFNVDRFPGWLLDDPARMAAVVRVLSIAAIAKYWLAAYSWRRVSARYVRQYLLVWGTGTTCLLALGLLLWGVVRIYVALDLYSFQTLMILLALLALPLARVGFAPSGLARNRHR